MPNIDVSKLPKVKNLIEVTAKHIHPKPACTAGHHNSTCAGLGRETKCTEVVKIINGEEYSFGCICEHHVGPDLPLARLILE